MRRTHETAAIVSIGDELATGASPDTNAQWIAARLTAAGLIVREHATVDDELERLRACIARLAGAHDLVVCTGGLGPTPDDLTRAALAAAAGDDLVEDGAALAQIEAFFERAGRAMPEANRVQALRPSRAACLRNERGTAPGLWMPGDDLRADVACLPGPPREMVPMFEAFVAPALRPVPGRVVRSRVLRCFGIGESDLAERLGDLLQRSRNPLVGTTASGGIVSIRIRYEGDSAQAERLVDDTAREAAERAEPFVFGEGDRSLAASLLGRLVSRGQTLATVESCTGGLVGAMLTDVPGSSAAVVGGWVTYTNEMKRAQIGVPMEVFETDGAVSRACAEAMARGGLERSGADHCLSITGIAGPGGGTEAKPAGTVWIARASEGEDVEARLFRFGGERAHVRELSAMSAIAMLRFHLMGRGDVPLPREAEG